MGYSFSQIVLFLLFFSGHIFNLSLAILLLLSKKILTITDYTDVFSTSSLIIHAYVRTFTLFSNRTKVLDLLERMKYRFWAIDDVVHIHEKPVYEKYLQGIKHVCHVYVLLAMFANFTFIGAVVMAEGEALIFQCYRPQWIPYHVLLGFQIIMQLIYLNIPILFVDMLLMSIIRLTKIQFKLLNQETQRMYDIGVKERSSYIGKLIKHHNFLIDYTNRINTTFSTYLLAYIVTLVTSLCVEMYNLSSTGSEEGFVSAGVYLVSSLYQFFMFVCFPAQELVDEASRISESAYFSAWESDYKNSIVTGLIMTTAQKDIDITAGGFLKINHATGLDTVKTMVSYCMFLRAMGIE